MIRCGGCVEKEIDTEKKEQKMSRCVIKPAQAAGWAKCGTQGSECGEGMPVCWRHRRSKGLGGR